MKHISVLLNETVNGLDIHTGDVVLDGTLGGGGHTKEILKIFGKDVKVIGLDLDHDAIERVKNSLPTNSNISLVCAGFQDISKVLSDLNIDKVDRILLDLGISSFQLEEAGRGFTFQKDEPLLMTMKKNPTEEDLTAEEIVNTWEEESLRDIIYGFGEEKYAKKIANAIVKAREIKDIKTTSDLVKIINDAVGRYYKGRKINPATKTFQALRIAVNTELPNLEKVIEDGFKDLSSGGRMAIITFHSLEDRIVKNAFRDLKNKELANIINKKPIIPSEEELKENPRSRSAKLRIIEKI